MYRLLLVFTLIGLLACDTSKNQESNDFGPLAVIDDPGTGTSDALGGSGSVSITEHCVNVTLEANGEELLLVWRSAEVSWNDNDQEITFTSRAADETTPVVIHDGDNLTIGGESFETEGETKRDVDWVTEPHESCSGALFIVDLVTPRNA